MPNSWPALCFLIRMALHRLIPALFLIGHVVLWAAPFNDNFTDRQLLRGPAALEIDTELATVESNEPQHFPGAKQSTVWFEWTSESNGGFYIQKSSLYDFAVYQGTALANLQRVPTFESQGARAFIARESQSYLIAVAQKTASTVKTGARITESPPHDLLANARAMTDSILQDVGAGATRSADEPLLLPDRGILWTKYYAAQAGPKVFSGNVRFRLFRDRDGLLEPLGDGLPGPDNLSFKGTWVDQPGNFVIAAAPTQSFFLRLIPPPANDLFSNALKVSRDTQVIRLPAFAATTEPLEPIHWPQLPKNSLWFSILPTPGFCQLTVTNIVADVGVSLYRGTTLAELTPVASIEGPPPLALRFHADGDPYWLVYGQSPEGGLEHSIRISSASPNDNFSNAFSVTDWFSQQIGAATLEPGEVPFAPGQWGTLWFRFTSPAEGKKLISAANSQNSPLPFRVYTGQRLTSLNEVALDPYEQGSQFYALKGLIYHIAVAVPPQSTGLNLRLSLKSPHRHDTLATPLLWTQSTGTNRFELTNATVDATEPHLPSGHGSIWASFSTPRTGHYFLRAEDNSARSVTNIAIEVFDGHDPTIFHPIHRFRFPNMVEFNARLGQRYWVRLSGPPENPSVLVTWGLLTEPPAPRPPTLAANFSALHLDPGIHWWRPEFDGVLTMPNANSQFLDLAHFNQRTLQTNVQFRLGPRPYATHTAFAVHGGAAYWIRNSQYRNLLQFHKLDSVRYLPQTFPGGNRHFQLDRTTNFTAPESGTVTLGPEESAWLETVVAGPRRLNFWVKTSGTAAAHFYAAIDSGTSFTPGELVLIGSHDWTKRTLDLPHEANTIRLVFENRSQTHPASAWLDIPALENEPGLFLASERKSSGTLELSFPALRDQRYQVEFSLDLDRWYVWSISTPASSGLISLEVPSVNPGMFFRVATD